MFKIFAILFITVWAVQASNKLADSAANSVSVDTKGHSEIIIERKDSTCCVGDKLNPEYSRQMHEIKRQCALKFRANNTHVENFNPFCCKTMAKIEDLIICEEECFARALHQIDENGKFNREAIKQHYAKHTVADIEWKKAALDGYIDDCLVQVIKSHNQTSPSDNSQCNSAALDLHRCIWIKFRSNCPVELRYNSSRCINMRQHLNQNSDQLFYRQLFLKFAHQSQGLFHAQMGAQKEFA